VVGIGQVTGYDETAIFMARHGLIGNLLPIAVFIDIGGRHPAGGGLSHAVSRV